MYQTLVSLCLISLAFCSAVYGQGGFGTIAGRVTDPSGAGVPGAKVIVTNTATNFKAEGTANQNGDYHVLQLPPGAYDLQVEANGFKRLSRRGIKLQVSDRITFDLTLELGEVTETVTVEAEAPLLRTQDAQTGEVINNAMIRNLPQLNRDPLQLLTLAGNVQGGGGRAQPGSDTRINGGRTVALEYIVDGITAGTGLGHNVVSTTPTMETIAEFKVITNGISAEYGRLSGGAVELVTKSGSNEFHGQLFEYMQNDVFNANSWFQNSQGGRKVHFTQNIFGGYVGGPIWIPRLYQGRDRTFFTFNYEGTRRRTAGALQVTSVPTEAERRGDFSQTIFNGIAPLLYDQDGPVVYEAASNTYRRQVLLGDGKRIPETRIHPVSRALLQSVPLPNRSPRPGTSSSQNYAAPQSGKTDSDLWSLRIDHLLAPSHRLFGRFQTQDSFTGSTRWAGPASTAIEQLRDGAFGMTLNYDWTISPTLLLNARAGGHYNPFSSGNLLPSDFSSAGVQFDSITRSLLGTRNVPTVRIAGGTSIASSASLGVTNTTSYDTGLALTKILNRHTLKFGFQHHRYFDNFFNSGSGVFSFLASPVHEIAGVDFGFGSDISTAYGTAAFLVGVNNQANASGDRTRAMNLNYYAAYIQDDFKLSSKLMLNLGLRWDMDTPVTERFDKLYFWDRDAPPPFQINPGYDFNAAVRAAGLDPAAVRVPEWVRNGFPSGALRIANTPEFPSRKGTKYYPRQFAPRIGMAYQLDSKTVLRGSFAQMFISATGSAGAFSTGGETVLLADGADAGWHASNDNLVHLISNFTNPYQPNQFSRYQRTNQAANFQATSPTGPAGAFSRNLRMPREWTWSFGLQRELPKGFLVEAMYNANLGRKLVGPDIIGRFPADLFTGGPSGQNARIYTTQIDSPTAGQTLTNQVAGPKQNLAILENAFPYFGTFAVQGVNLGRSDFHALNLRAERRMAQGIALLANYTFSKSLDDVGGPDVGTGTGVNGVNLGGKRVQTVDNTPASYGISPIDETHRFTGTYIIELPVGRGKKLLGSPNTLAKTLLDHVAGGWELAGTAIYRSGRPVVLRPTTPNINNNIRVEWTFGSYLTADPNISNPRFSDNSQVFYSTRDARPGDPVRRFFNVTDARLFTYGTLPPIHPQVRHPGRTTYDLSLMKNFFFSSERTRYLQFRMEGVNIFNIRGFGDYDTTIGTINFGFITSARNVERQIQMSARLVF